MNLAHAETRTQPLQPVKYQQYTPIEPPAGMTYLAFLRTWTDEYVARWLTDIKCGYVILELDQITLKEMGISSIGDRLRIVNAVKVLRQRVAGRAVTTAAPTHKTNSSVDYDSKGTSDKLDVSLNRPGKSRSRILPAIIREQPPDSARSVASNPPIRPLPLPTQSTPPSNTQLNTPSSKLGASYALNQQLGQSPPACRPSARQPRRREIATCEINITSSSCPSAPSQSRAAGNTHPYANAQATLHPPSNLAVSLSPIEESFSARHSPPTPSPPTQGYTVGRGPFNTGASNNPPYSLDDLRRKLVKFVLHDEGHSSTIDVASCTGGVEVIEKVLKKFGKGSPRGDDMDVSQTEEGGLMVDGWSVYMDMGQEDGPAQPLTEAELLSICHAPDHPTREHGLLLRKIRRPDDRSGSPSSTTASRNTKRASSISILSGLGVHDPEKALEPPSPTGRLSPAVQNAKRPSKLRNFFGQRPPSELITNHLTEYFPNTEKKVLQRTARHSMMRRRESVASYNQQMSRFSGSTQGSAGRRSFSPRSSTSTLPPPVPDKTNGYEPAEDLPRMSLSTEDGRSVDLPLDTPQLLPPIPFPTESLSESMEGITRQRSMSRTTSMSSKRMSYMTELRSKRDRSDTASLMTVDEITAEVENRRVSKSFDRDDDLDGWTKVDTEIENMVPKAVADDDGDVDVEAEDSDDETSEEDEDETLREEEELSLDVDDDGCIRNVVNAKTANKWIKGALIGAGSFGKVYLGMDASNGLLMAVKQVELPTGSAPNQERKKSMLSALEREIELLKNLQHENIVQYLYSSIDDEYLNIFLEYVPGGSVTALLRNYGAFEEPLVKNFVRQILQGLDYLHERDIIHRDIKGANILISDFGISKKVDDNLLTGNRINRPSLQGSVFWMAPEVVKQTGHTRKADIWSVGCLVHPWAQLTQMQAIFKIGSSARPTIPSDISSEAQTFCLLQHPWIVVDPKASK
ncbi:hypothetical protein BDZ97DRAFT_1904602 [Flammula alnicola]|nr:hypothetical protein BDZ97DRAFT_1904602 [Flammula alnicola]